MGSNSVTLIGTVSPGPAPGSPAPGVLTVTGDFSFAAGDTFEVQIGGLAPGNTAADHDQFDVTGSVSIGAGVTLNLSSFGGFTPLVGQQFVIVNNDGSDAVSGTFAGLPEGTLLSNFLGSGLYATISYLGTDATSGNDVVLTVATAANVAPVVIVTNAVTTIDEGVTFSGAGLFIDPGADTWTATVDYGDGTGPQALALVVDKTFALSHVYNDNGSYSVTIVVADADAAGGVGSTSLPVTVNNVAPSANDDAANVSEDGPSITIGVLANDTDPGGAADPLTVTSIDTVGTLGAVAFTASGVTYDPNGQFEQLASGQTATDTFAYAISDGDGGTGSALVTVTIMGVNDNPVAMLGGSSGTEPDDLDQTFNWDVTDVDGNLDTVVVDVTRDGVPVGSLSGPASPSGVADFNSLGVGDFEITLTATDTDGAVTVVSRSASVIDDDTAAPTITLGGSSGTQLEIDTNEFSWDVTDVSGLSALSVVVTLNTDAGPVILYSTTDLNDAAGRFNFDDQGVGVFEIVVVATDGDSDWAGDGAGSTAGRTTVVGELFISTSTRAKLEAADGEWVTLNRSDMTSVASGNVLFDSSQLSHPWFSWWRPNLDAFHMLEDGSMILSTSGSGQMGDTDFRNGGLVRFYGDEWLARNAGDPGGLYQSAEMIATEVQIFGDNRWGTNVDAISIAADGDLVISIGRGRALADGQTYRSGDLIKITLRKDGSLAGSSLYFDSSVLNATGAFIFGNSWSNRSVNVNGAHVLDDGRIVLTTRRTTVVGDDGPSFEDGDLFVYDPNSGIAEMLFDEDNFRGNEDIDAVFIGIGNGTINFLD